MFMRSERTLCLIRQMLRQQFLISEIRDRGRCRPYGARRISHAHPGLTPLANSFRASGAGASPNDVFTSAHQLSSRD
jgi:hypothetical protein